MATAYQSQSPGVYREEEFLKPQAGLPTGIAGFVGFAKSRLDSNGKALVSPATPVGLHHPEDFSLYFEGNDDSYLAETIRGFFLNGGTRCYVAFTESKDALLFQDAIESLAPLQDLDVLAVPDAISLQKEQVASLQTWVLKHCEEQGDRFAILDVPQEILKIG